MTTPVQPMVFVFWKYDVFPYLLGSAGTMQADGTYVLPKYGHMTLDRKNVIAVYPYELGCTINSQIQELTITYNQSIAAIGKATMAAIEQVLPELKR